MILEGKDIRLEPMEEKHLLLIKKWGSHKDRLLADYNISSLSYSGLKTWYKSRKKSMTRTYFAVFNREDIMVGYIGLKDMNIFRKYATLGIAFDPNYLERGYGSQACQALLRYAFSDLNLKEVYLEVNAFNLRARHTYKKFGFIEEGEFFVEFEIPLKEIEDMDIVHDKEYFLIERNRLLTRIIRMKLKSLTYRSRYGI